MKKYYPKSIMFYFSLGLLMIFFFVLLYVAVNFLVNFSSMQNVIGWLSFIFSIAGIAYFSYKTLHIIRRSIVVFDNKVHVREDFGDKGVKLQYEIDIEFINIQKISIVVDSNNSLNQAIRFVITQMPNIVILLNDGKEARINVYYYSKRQTIEVIDYIIDRKKIIDPTFSNKSGQELVDDLSSIVK